MTREDVALYVTGNYDCDVAAFERALADDPALAEDVADEARFEMLLRDAVAAAVFCPACEDVVRGERCDSCGAAVRPGGYVIERVLVSNAHGRMYVAHDADGKQVALKELAFVQSPSASAIEAFEREAKFLRALEHPAIPRFVASFEEGRGVHTRYYLAQELVTGTPLDRLDEHWYTEVEIVDIARQVLGILVYLQSLSPMVVHRDIKPANLVRRADGSIALVDFGAAYVDGSTAGVTTVGTFGYMPVEQLAGIVDATTDLYALGASLLYLLTRQEPWRLAQSKTTANVSAPLRAYLDKLTASDPRARFASAKDALAALDHRDALVVKPLRRRWTRPALIAATAVALGAGGIAGYQVRAMKAHSKGAQQSSIATLRIAMPEGMTAELFVDDQKLATVSAGFEIPVAAGRRTVRLVGPNNARCEQPVDLQPSTKTTVECPMTAPMAPPSPELDVDTRVSFAFRQTPFREVLQTFNKSCGVGVVAPGEIDVTITAVLDDVPCNAALASVLEAHGLWYAYDPVARLVRIAPSRELDAERIAAAARPVVAHPPLPPGKTLGLDLDAGSFRTAIAVIIAAGGKLNVVLPDNLEGNVTIHTGNVPWDHMLEAVLASQGLWYRYREDGKIIRIAPRRELDAEDIRAHALP